MGKLLRLDKPNQLISVIPKSEINLIQQKCFNVFLRKAQRGLMFDTKYKNKEINKNTRYIFQIACKELKDKAGLSRNDYEYIKDELKKLTTIVVEVNDKNNKDHWSIFSLLERVEREGDIFEFSLDWMIMKALKEHNYFTKIDLLQIAKLDSRYSVILYEMAKRYYDKNNKYIKIPKMTVEEFRKTTKTENKYVLMADLKRYVLDKACKEISEKTDIILSYQTEKRGRKIAYIDFKIEKKIEQNTIPIKTPTQKEYSPEVLDLFQLLPAVEQVASNKRELAKLLTDHSFRYLKADILYAKNSKPDNFMAFLKSSCQNNHYSSAELQKQIKQKQLAQQQAEEAKKKAELEVKIKNKAQQKALEKYKQLSKQDLERYGANYQVLPKMLKEKVSKKDFIIGALEEEIEAELRDLLSII